MPHPKKSEAPSMYDLFGKLKPKEKEEPEEKMDMLMIRRREKAIKELSQTEGPYSMCIQILTDVYRDCISGLLTKEQKDLFFQYVEPLVETSIRLTIYFKEQISATAEFAEIGKVFVEELEDFQISFVPYIDKFLEMSEQYDTLINTNKKFAKAIKQAEGRNPPFMQLMNAPLQRIGKYTVLLNDIIKSTPEWHDDYKFLKEALETISAAALAAEKSLTESARRSSLTSLQQSIRGCPPLLNPKRRVIGKWEMKEEKTEIHVLTDLLLIAKQKVEILSRKRYYQLKQSIDLHDVKSVLKDKNGVRLKTRKADIVLQMNLKADELLDVIQEQLSQL